MANRVTISTFGLTLPEVPLDRTPRQAVAQMMDFWKGKLDGVLPDQPDVIVLPEVCDIPRNWRQEKLKEFLAARGTSAQEFFSGVARDHHCYITYAAARQVPDGTWRNSTTLLDRRGGVAGVYDKNHVTINEYEDWGVRCGKEAGIFECDFGRVACAICFDIYFDDIRQKIAAARPDLILFSSMVHGGLLQAQWAHSCRAHFVAALHANRPSAIISPTGEILAKTTLYFDYVTATVNLDCRLFHVDGNRPKLEAARAKYGRKLTVRDPSLLNVILLSSEAEEFTVEDVAREFDIEPLDDYLNRSAAHTADDG